MSNLPASAIKLKFLIRLKLIEFSEASNQGYIRFSNVGLRRNPFPIILLIILYSKYEKSLRVISAPLPNWSSACLLSSWKITLSDGTKREARLGRLMQGLLIDPMIVHAFRELLRGCIIYIIASKD